MRKFKMSVQFDEVVRNLDTFEEQILNSIYYYEEECGITMTIEEHIEEFKNVSGEVYSAEKVEEVIVRLLTLGYIAEC